jgi:hypothetical protein
MAKGVGTKAVLGRGLSALPMMQVALCGHFGWGSRALRVRSKTQAEQAPG